MRRQFIISLSIFVFLVLATVIVVIFGKGYRFGFDKNKIALAGTGLLVAKSVPDGAQVFVNGHLTTATDNTINLFPDQYSIRIYKEGYFPWEKKIKIQKEVVAKAEALLFPTAPKLESITASGVENPSLDPSQTRIAYTVASQSSALKNGVYVLDMSSRPILTLQSSSTQVANDTLDSFSKAQLSWSPDGQELVATISASASNAAAADTTYLLDANSFNESPIDITATLIGVHNTWEKDILEKDQSRLATLKTKLLTMTTQNFNIIAWSPDETKILYFASQSATLPIIIQPRLIGIDSTAEERTLREKDIYVYDIKEDKNFKLDVDRDLQWFSDSKHIIYVHDKKIEIMDYDGTNATTIYAGPFVDNYVFPWPNGSKMVILTNLGNPAILPNLYTISLK